MKNLFLMILLFTSAAFAAPMSTSVCQRPIKEVALDKKMRLYSVNKGGLFGGGVCWWHSRMQRAAWYLTEFNPSAEKPTKQQAKKILDDLAHFRRVVVIPGYGDFDSFTKDHQKLVQKELNAWQARDGFLNAEWVRGLSGRAHYGNNSEKAQTKMDDLWQAYLRAQVDNQILWLKMQMPGLVAHSALLINMEEGPRPGDYNFSVVDSNMPHSLMKWQYKKNESYVHNVYGKKMMPEIGFEKDLVKIEHATHRHCTDSLYDQN